MCRPVSRVCRTLEKPAGGGCQVSALESTGHDAGACRHAPENLEDIIALISLYRPGPMDSSIPTYLRNRKDPSHVTYKTPQMAHIVDVTNGVVIYQSRSCRSSAASWPASASARLITSAAP